MMTITQMSKRGRGFFWGLSSCAMIRLFCTLRHVNKGGSGFVAD
jgi:hypothetical protein